MLEEPLYDLSEPIEAALAATAAALDGLPGPALLEKPIEDALLAELTANDDWSEASSQHGLALSGWEGRLGAADAAGRTGDAHVLFEVKSQGPALYNCSWDAAKLARCVYEATADLGVLVAAATAGDWRRLPRGAELFETRRWRIDVLLQRFRGDFAFWRNDVATRPKRLPAAFSTYELERFRFALSDGEPWELRAAVIGDVDADEVPVDYIPVVATWRRGADRPVNVAAPSVEVLEIKGGSGLGPAFSVAWNGHELVYTSERLEDRAPERAAAQPTEPQWRAFWRRLDELDVWSWARSYEPETMRTDGYDWSITIAAGGRRAQSRGYDAWPGPDPIATWDAFTLALRDLLAGLPVW